MGQEQGRRHDGTVAEPNGDGCPSDAVAAEDSLDVVRQDRRAGGKVRLINRPVREPMEEFVSTVDSHSGFQASTARSGYGKSGRVPNDGRIGNAS